MEIKTRQQALKDGSKYYFTGKPCVNGHIAKRRTSERGCIECAREYDRRRGKSRYAKLTEEKRQEMRERARVENLTEEQRRNKRERAKRSYEKNRKHNLDRHKKRREQPGYYKRVYANRKKQMNEDPNVKLRIWISLCVHAVLNKHGKYKEDSAIKLCGYTESELREHLERQFDKNMTWENHGTYWHIDHITPVSKFVEDGISDPKVVNALSNLRPLKASENIGKSDKIEFLI